MATDFGAPGWFTLVSDADTPALLTQYAGRIVGIPEGKTLPDVDTLIIQGASVPGFRRNGPSGLEWMMRGPQDPDAQFVNTIPGPGGWTRPESKATYMQTGKALREFGVPSPQLRTGLKQLYDAAVSNHVAANP